MSCEATYNVEVGGHACLDQVLSGLDHWPVHGDLALVKGLSWRVGGPGLAFACALAKYSPRFKVRFRGVIGEGPLGDQLLTLVGEFPVNTDTIVRRGVPSFTVVGVEEDAERTFLHSRGANDLLTSDMLRPAAEIGVNWYHHGGVGLTPCVEGQTLADLLAQMGKKGVLTSFDTVCLGKHEPGSRFPLIKPALPHAGFVFMSAKEALAFTGMSNACDVLQFLADNGAQTSLVKDGINGVWVKVGHGPAQHVPAFSVNAKDTTGAGDAFCAFCAAHFMTDYFQDLSRWSENAARHAVVGSALLCEQGRGVHGAPTREMVLNRMQHAS